MVASEARVCPDTPFIRFGVSRGFYTIAALTFFISLVATVYFCVSMDGGMEMPGGWTMLMIWMRMPGQTWPESAGMFVLMWIAMMIMMMLPSASPRLARLYHSLLDDDAPAAIATTMMAAFGYFAVWTIFGLCLYPIGIVIASATMTLPAVSRMVPVLSGFGLILSGIFQFTRWKKVGLGGCGCHAELQIEARGGPLRKGWMCGVREGKYCVICCSGLMLTLLILGSMNLLVMFIVAGVITGEKLLRNYTLFSRLAGCIIVGGGMVMTVRSVAALW